MLTAHQVTSGYPPRPPVLVDASLTVQPRARIALLGANGSGKTTLLRCLSGAQRPQTGTILREGVPLVHTRAGLRAHRSAVQLVLQDPDDQLFSADVVGDVSFGPLNQGLSDAEARERVDEALALLSITHLAQRATHQLSWGERKRVALAGAVAMRPGILLLDEPTAGLDPVGVAETRDMLERLHAKGTSLVLATHDLVFAQAWADEVAVVCAGAVTQGPTAEVLADEELLARARLLVSGNRTIG